MGHLQSDLIHLANFAKAHRLQELTSEARVAIGAMNYAKSTFVVTGAERCDINFDKGNDYYPYNVECYFLSNRLRLSDLLAVAKSALPELKWGDVAKTKARLEDVDGNSSSLWVNITRFKTDPDTVHVFIHQSH